jgi:hypothetical protein
VNAEQEESARKLKLAQEEIQKVYSLLDILKFFFFFRSAKKNRRKWICDCMLSWRTTD